MRISQNWLREWVEVGHGSGLDFRALGEVLTLGGLEVSAVEEVAPALPGKELVVGEIVGSGEHPKVPRLRVCEVEAKGGVGKGVKGGRFTTTVVCGAANAVVGVKAPLALPGAKLPNLKGDGVVEVGERVIQGVRSVGMLCSAAELGLEEQSAGIMELHADARIGAGVREYLGLDDLVLEIELTPNRGDCLSMRGVAREVVALVNANGWDGRKVRAKLREPTGVVGSLGKARGGDGKGSRSPSSSLPIELQAAEGCPRYVGRAIRGADLRTPTPDWMKERLRRGGVRSINIVVDVTNYVMLELGQPMHAFDLAKLEGGIVVRWAKKGEELQLLDERVVKLGARHLVIADKRKAVALAGIMGGKNSAISEDTRDIYFESAFFSAANLLGKAREFGLHTDASHRFERGVDSALQVAAMERASELLIAHAGGEAGAIEEACVAKMLPRAVEIDFEAREIERLLGVAFAAEEVRAVLEGLGMGVKGLGSGGGAKQGWRVTPPSWRSDIRGAHDLVEEVGRVLGYARIAPRAPTATARSGGHAENRMEIARLKQRLVERGYFEAITYSFVDAEMQELLTGERGVELRNPIADNMTVMRRSLWTGLLQAVQKNCNRQQERVRLFEEGKVFPRGANQGKGEGEVHRLGGAVTGAVVARQWGEAARGVDFFDVKDDVLALLRDTPMAGRVEFEAGAHAALHPGRSACMKIGAKVIGYLGQLHPNLQKRVDIEAPVYLFEVDVAALEEARLPAFAAVSRYPAIQRDLAIVVGREVAAGAVQAAVVEAGGALLVGVELFDIYAGERIEKGRKSFAFGLTFQDAGGSLTAHEVDGVMNKIINNLQHKFNAKLR